LSLKVVESSRERHHDKRGCPFSFEGGRIKDPRADDPTNVGIVASDRIIPIYPARVESALAPAGAGWIVLTVVAILFFLSFGLIWFFLGR